MKLFSLFIFLTIFCTFSGCATTAASSCPEGTIEVPLTQEHWKTEYEGFGKVSIDGNSKQIKMSPKAARTPQSTHASLVVSKLALPANEFDVFIEYKNEQTLRNSPPNPWELLWVFFQYQAGPADTKTTNYVVAKANGIELGKAFGHEDQIFLKTSEQPKAAFNKWHTLRLRKRDSKLEVYFDNKLALNWQEQTNAQLFNQPGKIGLYSEDASVTIRRVCAQP